MDLQNQFLVEFNCVSAYQFLLSIKKRLSSVFWHGSFLQIAPYDQLQTIERLVGVPQLTPAQVKRETILIPLEP